MKIKLAILWTLSIALLAFAEETDVNEVSSDSGHYMILFPRYFTSGKHNSIGVSFFKTVVDTELTIEVSKGNVTYATVVNTFAPDTSSLVQVLIPSGISDYFAMLRVSGVGGAEFNVSTRVMLTEENRHYRHDPKTIFLQTDKPIYKPNDVVRFRTFGLNKKLVPLFTPMTISLYDENDNLLEKWIDETPLSGVVSKSFQLSDKPVLGSWRIQVQQGDVKFVERFEVREYQLPKYEVTVEANTFLPDFSSGFLYLYNDTVDIKVHAKYTFGRPVIGKLELNISSGREDNFKLTEIMDIDGSVDLKIPLRRLFESQGIINVPQYSSYCRASNIEIKATVTEALTQKTMTSRTTNIRVEKAPVKIYFKSGNNIKIGLVNYATIEVNRADGNPLTEGERSHPLKVTFSNGEAQEYIIPEDGNVVVELMYPELPRSNIQMEATYEGDYKGRGYTVTSKKYQTHYRAVNNTNIDVKIPKNYYKVGDEIKLTINSTHPLSAITVSVMKNSHIILNKYIDASNQMTVDVDILATEDMIPDVDILFSGLSIDNSFVVDAANIPVTVTLENSVSAEVSATEGRAGDKVSLNLRTDPLSAVFVMAIDKSTELVKKHKYITEEDVLSVIGGAPGTTRKINSYNPTGFIRNFGLNAITNIPGIQSLDRFSHNVRHFSHPVGSANTEIRQDGGSRNAEKPRIRMFFPETWIWEELQAGLTGEVNMTKTIPDSITKWVANAFAVNPSSGIGILKKPAEFYSFQPFFINLDYPYSVLKGETFSLKVSVFNYLKTDQHVNVTFLDSDEFTIKEDSLVQTVTVKSNEQTLVTFHIKPEHVGFLSLRVRAVSSEASDEVHKYLTVKPEGITKYFNKAIMMNITEGELTLNNFEIPHADVPNRVADSGRVEVSIIGDLMGQAIDKAASLIRMPYGCGEQNMINFAPNIYIYSYLKNSNRLAEEIKTKLVGYTKKGYKNELSYQHKDGSYSAFGNQDPSGSTWLTAFVLKCFAQAKKVMPEVYIDDDVIAKGLKWLLKQHTEKGNFLEHGHVIHREMQGGSSEGKAMTAYILITLLENKDLILPQYEELMKSVKDEVINSATEFLSTVSGDSYSKAITMYAMALMGKEDIFKQLETDLESAAVVEGDFKYWKTTKVIHSRSAEDKVEDLPNVEMSSYILLAYSERKEIEKGLPIMRWLISQRSSLGGYHSTQDTVIALEALSKFSTLIYGCCNQSITLKITDNTEYSYTFPVITFDTSTILYKHLMPSDTKSISFVGSGKGFALVQVAWQYNILKEEELKSNIESTVESYCVNENTFTLRICNAWLLNGTSGMVLTKAQLPSGYIMATSDGNIIPNVKLVEVEDSEVNVYSENLSDDEVCITIAAERSHEVENLKTPLAVKTSLYYNTDESVLKTYEVDCSHGKSE